MGTGSDREERVGKGEKDKGREYRRGGRRMARKGGEGKKGGGRMGRKTGSVPIKF